MPNQPQRRGRRRAPTPLSSFDPRFRDLLLRGAQALFTIECRSRNEAIKLRQRVNMYRSACKDHFGVDNEAQWMPLYRCIIQQDKALLTFRPRDSEFDVVLAQAPIASPLPPSEPLLGDDFLERIIGPNDLEEESEV